MAKIDLALPGAVMVIFIRFAIGHRMTAMETRSRFSPSSGAEQQRWAALMNRQPVDRVPLFLASFGFSLLNCGNSIAAGYEDPETSFWAQVRTNEMYGATHCVRFVAGAFGAREFGGEVQMPDPDLGMAPSVLRAPITSESDLARWEEHPPDARKTGSIPLYLRFSQLEAAHGYPITLYVGGILTGVSALLDLERMCRWMIKEPLLLHRVCRLFTDFLKEMVAYWVETFGPERILGWNVSPAESNQIISPRQFDEFALPYQQEVYDMAQSRGIRHFYTHICGEQNANLRSWSRLSHGDPGIISIGHEITIETAAAYFPEEVILGNLNPTIIQLERAQKIYDAARDALVRGKRCPSGFVLSPGCELPPLAPPENVKMLKRAIEEAGCY